MRAITILWTLVRAGRVDCPACDAEKLCIECESIVMSEADYMGLDIDVHQELITNSFKKGRGQC